MSRYNPAILPVVDERGVSVGDFARQSGETDDTGRIGRAITYAKNNNIGKIVFPTKTYTATAITFAQSNLEIDFQGSTLQGLTGSGTLITISGSNVWMHDFILDGQTNVQYGIDITSGFDAVTIERGIIKNIYASSSQSGAWGILAGKTSNITIRNVEFTGIHAAQLNSTTNGLARGIDITVDHTADGNKMYIGHCLFDDIHSDGGGGTYPDKDADAIVIENDDSTDSSWAMANCVIEHNTFKVVGKRFVKVMFIDGVTIRNNVGQDFPNLMWSAFSIYSSKNVVLEKNQFYNINAWATIDLERSTFSSLQQDGIRIIDNRLVTMPNFTTSYEGFPSLIRLYDNNLRQTGQSQNIYIQGNVLDGAAVGIYIHFGYDVHVIGNYRYNGYWEDFIVTGYSQKLSIHDNHFLPKTYQRARILLGGWIPQENISEFSITGNLINSPHEGIQHNKGTYGLIHGNMGNCTYDIVSSSYPTANSVQIWGNYNERTGATQITGDLLTPTLQPIASGTTANRPNTALVSAPYFDTSLGKPVWCKTLSVAEVATLNITTGATTAGNVTVTLNGTGTTVAVAAGDSASTVASKISSTNFSGFTTSLNGTTITFTSVVGGAQSAPTFADTGTTGTAGTMTVTTTGANAVWIDATGATV